MRNPAYLCLSRHGIYYIRFPIPRWLHPEGSKTCIRVSLRCREPRIALGLARQLCAGAARVCEEAAAEPMRYEEIRELLQTYFANALASHKEKVLSEGRSSRFVVSVYEADVQRRDEIRRTGRRPSEDERAIDELGLSEILERAGVPNLTDDLKARVLEEYRNASRSYSKAVLAFESSLDDYDLDRAATKPSEKSRGTKSTLSVAALAKLFTAYNTKQGLWNASTARERERHFDLLTEMLGESRVADAVGVEDARRVRDLLLDLPSNRNKKQATKSLSVEEQASVADAPKMQQRTIKKHLQTYHGLFAWAAQEKHVTTNPFEGIKTLSNARALQGNERAPFSEDQLAKMLAALTTTSSDMVRKDYQRWGSLIGIFSGARLNEICQLEVNDIRQEAGRWCFDLNDEGEGKTLKTGAARRLVPVHSFLLAQGLLSFVERVRKTGETRLFSDLTYDPKNKWGRALSRWFNDRLLVRLGMKSKQLTFHSLRHTMVNRLLNAGVEEAVVKALVGHRAEGVTQATYNRAGYSIERKAEAIERFSVPVSIDT